MDCSTLVEKAQGLSDIELAILLCLMARQHCIIRTDPGSIHSLTEEVQLVSGKKSDIANQVAESST